MAKKSTDIASILSIIVGIIILIWKDFLAVAVGLFLVITGILKLLDQRKS